MQRHRHVAAGPLSSERVPLRQICRFCCVTGVEGTKTSSPPIPWQGCRRMDRTQLPPDIKMLTARPGGKAGRNGRTKLETNGARRAAGDRGSKAVRHAICSIQAPSAPPANAVVSLSSKNHQQQLQGPRKTNQDKTNSYCLDRRYVIPHAEFSDLFRDQNVKTQEPKNDHRDAAQSDHVSEYSSLHGHCSLCPDRSQRG